MDKMIYVLNLQLFADGGEGGSFAEGSENEEGSNGLANQEVEYVYGKQGDDQANVEAPVNLDDGEDEYASFREKYKEQIGKEIQDAVQKRFKNQQDNSEALEQMKDLLYPMYLRYGLEEGNIDSLREAMEQDNALLEDRAYDSGYSPDQYRYVQALERKVANQEKEQKQKEAMQKARSDYDKWMAEAQELQQIYPNFSIDEELANEDFKRDLISGKSMKRAFETAHFDEILEGAIQRTASNVRDSVIGNIKARGMRPAENGSSSKAGVQIKSDVNNLDDRDIDRIIKQVRMGKKISF